MLTELLYYTSINQTLQIAAVICSLGLLTRAGLNYKVLDNLRCASSTDLYYLNSAALVLPLAYIHAEVTNLMTASFDSHWLLSVNKIASLWLLWGIASCVKGCSGHTSFKNSNKDHC